MKTQNFFSSMAFLMLFSTPVHAADYSVEVEVSCLGADGVPQSQFCCANPGHSSCGGGFQSAVSQTLNIGLNSVYLGNQILEPELDDGEVDGSGSTTGGLTSGNTDVGIGTTASNGTHGSQGSALWNQNTGSGKSPNLGIFGKAGKGKSGSASGSGSGSSGSGGGGIGSIGSTGSDSSKGKHDPNNVAPNGDAYASVNGDANAKGAGGAADSIFGGLGKGAGAGVGVGGPDELSFGEDGNAKGDANALNEGEDDGSGSALDPSDYFSRIDKSASIFRVVSARYMKKKSLWAPKKLPEKNI